MGILADGGAIFAGGLLGSLLGSRIKQNNMQFLALVIMIISLPEAAACLLAFENGKITTHYILPVVACLFFGACLGDALKLSERVKKLEQSGRSRSMQAFCLGCLFFGIGGLQMTAPIAWALRGDSGQLLLKTAIDFPFALAFGAMYGRGVCASGVVVLAFQLAIGGVAYAFSGFFSDALITQLCAVGYILLFFMGFNLMQNNPKIDTLNMLPSLLLLCMLHVLRQIW